MEKNEVKQEIKDTKENQVDTILDF